MRRTVEEILASSGPIAAFVRCRRRELGYTQEVLAKRAGVGQRFLKELELGKQSLRLDKASQLVSYLGGEITVKTKGES